VSATLLAIIGHTSFALTALSFYLRDILLLRALAIVSGLVGMVYNYFVPGGPLWLVLFWLAVFISINTVRIVGIFAERRAVSFTDDEAELYETIFRSLSPVEFMKLMRIATWRTADPGFAFTEQGQPLEGLKLLFNGEVAIERDGKEVDRGHDGAMIGEISFIQGGAATATVTAALPCRYIFWPIADLQKLLARNPTLDIAMKHVFSMDLSKKLIGRKGDTDRA
jgi:CRP-like cAMP-binding protein